MDKSPSHKAPTAIIVTTAMLTFISFWRAASVVLCDLASSAYYVGGIAEKSIGRAAPWFVLGVMLFANLVRIVYIESCAMFVRGGVFKTVRRALGSNMAKLAVSALMFDYILTGPISSVAAGHYIVSFVNSILPHLGIPLSCSSSRLPNRERVVDIVSSQSPVLSISSRNRCTYSGLAFSSAPCARVRNCCLNLVNSVKDLRRFTSLQRSGRLSCGRRSGDHGGLRRRARERNSRRRRCRHADVR